MALTMKALQEQIDKLSREIELLKSEKNVTGARKLHKGLHVGDKFDLCGLEWTILDIHDGHYDCLGSKLEDNRIFDHDFNAWRTSSIRKYLNGNFFDSLSKEIGADNIILAKRDLLSLDGQTEYGVCEDKVSLLTVDEYRKYRNMIENTDYWWWLITPWSTYCNDIKKSVAVVSPGGLIYWGDCDRLDGGVRPFVSFSYAIFVSEDN